MRLLAEFVGKNSEFRAWLAAQRGENVVSLADFRHKKSRPWGRSGRVKPSGPSIA